MGPAKCLNGNSDLGGPDLFWIVLYPAGFRKDLLEFLLSSSLDRSVMIKQNCARASRSLIQRQNVGHGILLCPGSSAAD